MPVKKKSDQSLKDKDQSKWWIWPAIIVGLMVLQIALSLTAVYFAMTDNSFAVEPSYYSRATNFLSNHGPAWQFYLSIGEKDSLLGQNNITLDIMDASGERIGDAEVGVVGFHHSNAKASQRITMLPTELGDYRGKITLAKQGLWQFQITARVRERLCEHVQTVRIGNPNIP